MNFNFGNNPVKTTASSLIGTPNPASSSTALNLSASTTSSGLTFGTPTGTGTGFTLVGAGDSKSNTGLGLSTPAQSTPTIKPIAATTPFSLVATPSSAQAGSTTASPAFTGFGLTPATTALSTTSQTATVTPSFSISTASTPATTSTLNFSLTPSTATTTTTTLKLGTTTTTTTSLGQTTLVPTATTFVTSSAAPAAAAPTGNITFVQLEENLKKWEVELEEQEKTFISQAAQINNWDLLLHSNSDKIVALNEDTESLRLLQQQLDNELDFVVAQQKELEEVLSPLERQVADMSANTDPEREHVYHMSETLDTQLKQMSEDLREIIDNVNESNQTQDNTDPIVQIGRILNAHMGSLQWIDQMTLNIQNQLENVTKLHDNHRRENERSFRISYE